MMSLSSKNAVGTSNTGISPVRTPYLLLPADLPAWESFPLADRHLVIGVIVQTARRQLPARPALDREAARR
jgi:hypothetical protein